MDTGWSVFFSSLRQVNNRLFNYSVHLSSSSNRLTSEGVGASTRHLKGASLLTRIMGVPDLGIAGPPLATWITSDWGVAVTALEIVRRYFHANQAAATKLSLTKSATRFCQSQ